MIKLLIAAVVCAALYVGLSKFWTKEKVMESAPVQYTQGLQQNVEKAEKSAAAANQKIAEMQRQADAFRQPSSGE